jgi:ribonuclease HI
MAESINIYTDGSSLGNPGPGGYGIILEWKKKNYIKEYSKGFKYTTNNRMELLAVVEALEKLKLQRAHVEIFTDSKYIVDSVQLKRVFKWKNNNFKKIKNSDLWIRFLQMNEKHYIKFNWIKGHNNHAQNERCDELAVYAAKNNSIEHDFYYEKLNKKVN